MTLDPQGGFDLEALMSQAQALQDQFAQAQQELGAQTVTGSAGGGLVEVTMTGTGEVTAVTISPEACDPTDTETLGDLVVAAIRDAGKHAQQLAAGTMPQLPDLPF